MVGYCARWPHRCPLAAESSVLTICNWAGIPQEELTRAAQNIRILSAREIEISREACKVRSDLAFRDVRPDIDILKLTREVLDIVAAAIRPGITTDELDAICHKSTLERNAYPSPLNYRKFPKSICTCVAQHRWIIWTLNKDSEF